VGEIEIISEDSMLDLIEGQVDLGDGDSTKLSLWVLM